MRVFHEPVSTDLTDMELIELKFIFARREFTRCTPKIMLVELLCQFTTTTVTMRFLPTINPDTDLRSVTRPLCSDRSQEYVSIVCQRTILKPDSVD